MNGDAVKVVPVRHYGRWVGAGFALLVVAMVIHTLFSKLPTGHFACQVVNGVRQCHPDLTWRFSWTIVVQYFTTSEILHGLVTTLELTVSSMIVGIVLGMTLAVMRLSPNRVLSMAAWTYTWFFRGTPVLVQLLVWYNIAILYPSLTLGIPFTPITFVHFHTVTLSPAPG
jgi:polar amino acid transport system permease protein